MDIRKEKKAIQAKAEKDLGFLFHGNIWDIIEEDVGNSAEDFEGDPDGEDQYIESYRDVVTRRVKLIQTVLPYIKAKPSTDENEKSPHPKKRYRKCFERRFYLVNFVLDRPYKRGTRIDWKRMVAAWNKVHPSDPMSLSLRVEYQRAIKEDTLMLQVNIVRRKQLLTTSWQALDKQLNNMANPVTFILASLFGQKMWNDTQPYILLLNEAIRNSPTFKKIKVDNPEQAARLESELDEIVKMGRPNLAVD